jgi:hypothetical protein
MLTNGVCYPENQRDFLWQESLQQRNTSKHFIPDKVVCRHIEVFTSFPGRPNAFDADENRPLCGIAMADEPNSAVPRITGLISNCGWKRDNRGIG